MFVTRKKNGRTLYITNAGRSVYKNRRKMVMSENIALVPLCDSL